MLLVNAFVYGILSYIWTKKSGLNLFFKTFFLVLALLSAGFWFAASGYVVRLTH